ncbi:hypothetical protein FPZ12_017560 [Amycolatopsis acidicola]|uniref:DUF3159 domain-containing protein n=1 Tax=Amycolatopsis acidicola TaxID=2596893 RepID=A0A5N0V1U8_9PSEU|nr:hypothetical protein [Amycolatopsis acidicola]KAA9160409.1 hypothetical protein FPZ12_017560 [Amycolatopsis acidicola]
MVIEIPHLRGTLARALVMLAETVIVPSVLLALLLHFFGLVPALSAVLGWSALVIGARRLMRRDLPRTLLLCTGMLVGRACFALVTSSAVVYVLQPALGSVLMFLIFVGSAVLGRPITARLAKDFVRLPAELFAHRTVNRVFVEVALLWGGSRLIDAAMTLGFLHWGVEAGLFSRGVLSGLLTALTVAVCAGHGWRKLRKVPGLTLRMGWRATATA